MIMKIIKTFKNEENWFETTEAEMIEKIFQIKGTCYEEV